MNTDKIKILPDNLINKIAAGEVVERPVSVVKELVENSLDAGAENIYIEIKDGGKSYIEVSDDGRGMDESNLLLAFERHATSKISEFDDLQKILTMGFRGEALPSIASVSMVEAVSKPKGAQDGTLAVIKAGTISEVKPSPSKYSTQIKVKSLFFNVPARKKFLSFDDREYKSIYTYFKKVSVSRPDIGFKLVNNDKTVFDLKPQTLEDRIRSLFPEIDEDELLKTENSLGSYAIKGFIGKAGLARKFKDNQFLFINGRIVESKMASFNIVNMYQNLIEPGYYPFYILFIDMPPHELDVNVHPSKLTVKFSDEQKVKRLITEAVGHSLKDASSITALSSQTETKEHLYEPAQIPQMQVKEQTAPYASKPEEKFFRPDEKNIGTRVLKINNELIVSENIWQMHDQYIFIQVESGSLIIDQHVAHERILYEKSIKAFADSPMPSQALLFPVRVDLSFEDRIVLTEMKEYLNKIGFILNEFGQNTFIIEETPMGLSSGDEKKELLDLIDNYKLYRKNKMDTMESVAASYACKRAIKAGKKLSKDEMLDLINDLFQCEFPHVCPHGRPVIIDLSLKELNKRFKRE
ncbi:MAG TPA: DNA mismatch repair endonuclease MutL [Clostridiales bacterium]|nr:DNA mismatch repair endonuclease MutL [Clostridiales bacterium]HQP70904.1 DNA mismatch repair endonuclease MutL [Clostridiales bacterium]